VRNASLWRAVLCVENTVVEDVEFDEQAQILVVHVRPRRASRGRCGTCGCRACWYDRGAGRRRWRALDMGTIQVFLEADAPRVDCPVHGPTVRQVPWARHGAGHTRSFDAQVAWLATHCSKRAITELMRIAWRSQQPVTAGRARCILPGPEDDVGAGRHRPSVQGSSGVACRGVGVDPHRVEVE
jgi:transposase